MRIRNKTSNTLKICFYVPGWDPREDVIGLGEITHWWLHLEEDDVLEIKENKRIQIKTSKQKISQTNPLTKEEEELILRIRDSWDEERLAINFSCLKVSHLGKFNPKFERLWLWESDEFKIVTFDEGNGECSIVALFSKRPEGVNQIKCQH